MRAVILCGGEGTRLRPLTYEVPKPLVPFRGRRLVDEVIDLFWEFDVYELWLSICYKPNMFIEEYSLPYLWEEEALGTAGFLKLIRGSCEDVFDDDFFVCNGDNLYDVDLDEMARFHKKRGFIATVCGVGVGDASGFGRIDKDDGVVLSFDEKSGGGEAVVNSGMYIFSPEVFEVEGIPWGKDKLSLEYDVFPALVDEGVLGCFESDGDWMSVNDFDDLEKAYKEWEGVGLG